MKWFTIINNPHNNYCGFDRSYSVWKEDEKYYNFNIIQDYVVEDNNSKELINYYNSNKLNFKKNKLLCISNEEIGNDNFNFIGFDCGYFQDVQADFYIGFSSIVNEVVRMNNEFCHRYRKYLNRYLLFKNIEDAVQYRNERDNILLENKYHLEDAFEDFTIMYIYLYNSEFDIL
ncbi:hypothetical protein [Treponema pedis]|uniref:hypothetical protein n=1 Tax=Treponema pedis TaxID=409322 RepID=UPI003D1D8B27